MKKIGSRNVFFTQTEIDCLRDVAVNWITLTEKENPEEVKRIMDKGLGTALRKLSQGLGRGRYFKKY